MRTSSRCSPTTGSTTRRRAAITTPKRVLSGDSTLIEFESGVHVDPASGDIFAPNNDTVDTLVVFKHGSAGDSAPIRALKTPHGTFGIAIDDRRNEMFLTTQHDATVVVFRKDANGDDHPLRLLQGDDTGLGDPHGIAIDPAKDVFYVANYGSHALRRADQEIRTGVPGSGKGRDKANWPYGREYAVPGSGRHDGPSISVTRSPPRGTTGRCGDQGTEDAAELADRPRLRRRAPRAVRRQRHGPVDPRVRRGRRRQRRAQARPEGTAHRPGASDVGVARHEERRAVGRQLRRPFRDRLPDRRVGRHAAAAHDPRRAGIGAVADDRQSRRAHLRFEARGDSRPQLRRASADRRVRASADGNAPRTRAIEGQDTMLGRTMHGIDYDEGRDEIVVPQQFGQAILVFKGSAAGETSRSASSRDRRRC